MVGAELVEVTDIDVEVELSAGVGVVVAFNTEFDVDAGVVMVVELSDGAVVDSVDVEVVVEEMELMDELVGGIVVTVIVEDGIEEVGGPIVIWEKPEGELVVDEFTVVAEENEGLLKESVEELTIVVEDVEFANTVDATDDDDPVSAVDEADEVDESAKIEEVNDIDEVDESDESDEAGGRIPVVEAEEELAAVVDVAEELVERVDIIEELVMLDENEVDELGETVDVVLSVATELNVEVVPALDELIDTAGTDEGDAVDDVGGTTELDTDDIKDMEGLVEDEL
jgi:hypothetical protein